MSNPKTTSTKYIEIKTPTNTININYKYARNSRWDVLEKALAVISEDKVSDIKYTIVSPQLEGEPERVDISKESLVRLFEQEQSIEPQQILTYLIKLRELVSVAEKCIDTEPFVLKQIFEIAKLSKNCVQEHGKGYPTSGLEVETKGGEHCGVKYNFVLPQDNTENQTKSISN